MRDHGVACLDAVERGGSSGFGFSPESSRSEAVSIQCFFTMVEVGCLAIVERRGSSGFSPVIPRSEAVFNVFSDPEVSAGNVCLPEKRVGAQ